MVYVGDLVMFEYVVLVCGGEVVEQWQYFCGGVVFCIGVVYGIGCILDFGFVGQEDEYVVGWFVVEFVQGGDDGGDFVFWFVVGGCVVVGVVDWFVVVDFYWIGVFGDFDDWCWGVVWCGEVFCEVFWIDCC